MLPQNDFVEDTTSENSQYVFSTIADKNPELEEKMHQLKIKKKSAIANLIFTSVVTVAPIVTDYIKCKKEQRPFELKKDHVVSAVVKNTMPIIEVADATILKGKISEKVPLSDIRNISNLIMVYKPVKNIVNNYTTNIVRRNEGLPPIEECSNDTKDAILGTAQLIMPYITTKFSDDKMKFKDKIQSILPIPVIGHVVKTIATRNPALRRAYDMSTSLLRVASGATRSINNAVRSSPNSSINKATNSIGNIIDTASELIGSSRGYIGSSDFYGRSANSYYNGGSSWNL